MLLVNHLQTNEKSQHTSVSHINMVDLAGENSYHISFLSTVAVICTKTSQIEFCIVSCKTLSIYIFQVCVAHKQFDDMLECPILIYYHSRAKFSKLY